jgi:hypothetical protein
MSLSYAYSWILINRFKFAKKTEVLLRLSFDICRGRILKHGLLRVQQPSFGTPISSLAFYRLLEDVAISVGEMPMNGMKETRPGVSFSISISF